VTGALTVDGNYTRSLRRLGADRAGKWASRTPQDAERLPRFDFGPIPDGYLVSLSALLEGRSVGSPP
jgi:hypothetical protein